MELWFGIVTSIFFSCYPPVCCSKCSLHLRRLTSRFTDTSEISHRSFNKGKRICSFCSPHYYQCRFYATVRRWHAGTGAALVNTAQGSTASVLVRHKERALGSLLITAVQSKGLVAVHRNHPSSVKHGTNIIEMGKEAEREYLLSPNISSWAKQICLTAFCI